MTEAAHAEARLARAGFRDPAAAAAELPPGWTSDPAWERLVDAVKLVPDPDGALRRLNSLECLDAAARDADSALPLLAVAGFGDYLFDVLRRVEGLALELLGSPRVLRESLRDFKDAELVHIAAADLAQAPARDSFVATGASLARLGDACLARAMASAGVPESMAVMAMGKFGGNELNYASDIDVLFVVPDGVDTGSAESAARRVMEMLNGPPTVFRTDADLRPEGRDGPLVRTLGAYEAYWARWAQVWEFQALIKCRFSAGDPDTGGEFLRRATPFVWPEVLASGAVEQVRALKARAESEVARRGLAERELKLGPGGIRDVEFAVQLLQLVHGRHRPELRIANTLEALSVLGAEGFVAAADAAALSDAYVFLRHTEHRLQLARGRQTHTLPKGPQNREMLARGLGFRDSPSGSALAQFESEWKRTTRAVRHLHERLFYRPLLETAGAAPAIGPALDAAEAIERLSALGFDRPVRTLQILQAMTARSTRAGKIMRAILPALLPTLAEAPDADAGLGRLSDLTKALESMPHLLALLRDEPPAAELLCTALGTGPVVAGLLERDPALVAALEAWSQRPERRSLVAEAAAVVTRRAAPADARTSLRRFKDGWWLRLCARDLAAGEDPAVFLPLARELSDVADACLEAALIQARAEQDRRTLGPPPGGFAVIALGRYGGRELGYSSDLDVLYVYEQEGLCPDGTEGRLYHTAVAERIGESLGASPPIFRVDTELRPEGRSGALVRSLEACAHYYERWAEVWEYLALVRARHAAGDDNVASAFLDAVAPLVWERELGDADVTEIRRIKARIERERVKAREDARYHVKLGVGGLADVEFTVQLLQLRHTAEHSTLRTPSTFDALDALLEAGLLSATDAAILRKSALLGNRVRNHLYLLRGLPTDVLPTADEELERLARSLGYGRLGRSRFLEDYRRTTRRARAVCDRLFYGEEAS